MLESFLADFKNAIHDTDREAAFACIHCALDSGITAQQAAVQIVAPSLAAVASAVVNQQAVLSQHYMATRISEEVTEALLPNISQQNGAAETVILGTARGDFHGLGKKIVGGCLKTNLLRVVDIGINVDAAQFVEAALQHNASVIGVSSMMIHTALHERGPKMIRTILRERGLEHRIKLIVGGAPYNYDDNLYNKAGADTWAQDGIAAIPKIKQLIAEVH